MVEYVCVVETDKPTLYEALYNIASATLQTCNQVTRRANEINETIGWSQSTHQ